MKTEIIKPNEMPSILLALGRLRVGMKATVFTISEWMANTIRREVTITALQTPPIFRPHYATATFGKYRIGAYKCRGKRNQYHLDVGESDLLFEGWDLPVVSDGDIVRPASAGFASCRTFSGDAHLNLAGVTPEFVRDFIDTKNLNPFFDAHDDVLYCGTAQQDDLLTATERLYEINQG